MPALGKSRNRCPHIFRAHSKATALKHAVLELSSSLESSQECPLIKPAMCLGQSYLPPSRPKINIVRHWHHPRSPSWGLYDVLHGVHECDSTLNLKRERRKQPTFFPRNWKAILRLATSHKPLNKWSINFWNYLHIWCLTARISISETRIKQCSMLLIRDMEDSELNLQGTQSASRVVPGCSNSGINFAERTMIMSHERTSKNSSTYMVCHKGPK